MQSIFSQFKSIRIHLCGRLLGPFFRPKKHIDANSRTIRELLDGAKFSIDFYQREYAWKERQIQELVDDLTGNPTTI